MRRLLPKSRPSEKFLRDKPAFDVNIFFQGLNGGRKTIELKRKQTLFCQGDVSDAVFYILKGKIKLTVSSSGGKEATIALLGPGEFAGEECVGPREPCRSTTATAFTACTALKVDRAAMMQLLNQEKAFSWFFISYLLGRNNRFQEDLIDQLFNSTERRLARTLLLLARLDRDSEPEMVTPKVSHETLAEMIGTTRSRVSLFMNQFRKLGYIEYNGTLKVHRSLLNVVLHD